MEDSKPTAAGDVLSQHEFAKGLYSGALSQSDKALALITGEHPIPTDVADLSSADAQVTQMVLAGAIIERMRQMIQVDATRSDRVLPMTNSAKEKETTTTIERWLAGVDAWNYYYTKRSPYRDATWWYLVRGRACLEVRLATERGTDFPIRQMVDDPNTIFPVRGRDGILWYTKEYQVYARELRADVRRLQESNNPNLGDTSWLASDDLDDNDMLEVVEYWDKEHHAIAVISPAGEEADDPGEHLIFSAKHDYGFLLLAEAHCLDTPLKDAQWAARSIIQPVVEHVKQYYLGISKVATGLNMFYYPRMYYKSMNNTPVIFDTGSPPDKFEPMSPEGQPIILNPQVNTQLVQYYLTLIRGDINLATLPETAWGSEPQSLQSGFAVAQVLSQVASAVQDKLPNLARAFGDHKGNILRLAKTVAGAKGLSLAVPVDYE